MVRTQIYLTEDEREVLKAMAADTGKKQSELIRDAIDQMIEGYQSNRQHRIRARAKGIWKGRADLPDFAALRRELDRI